MSPGAADHLAVQPAGRVQALVGGVGGTVSIRSTARTSTPNARRGRSFESVIVLVDRPGDHTLGIAASHGDWSAQSEPVVEGTTGVPQAIQVE